MSSSISVALIGFGFVGRTFHAPFILRTQGFELRIVASRHPELVHQTLTPYAVMPRVEADPLAAATADDIDLVVIASPNESHYPLAKAALEAGKHVVVDKPFVLDTVQAHELSYIATHQARVLSVFQNRRWDSDFLAIRQALGADLVGPIVEFESRIDRFRPIVQERWREQAIRGSGLWFDLGPHLADQALVLFGLPAEISATIATMRPDAVVDDWFHVLLHYPATNDHGPFNVSLRASMITAAPTPRFSVHGLTGSLIKRGNDVQEEQLRAGLSPLDDDFGIDTDPVIHYDNNGILTEHKVPHGTQRHYYELIREAIRGTGPNPVPPSQAIALMTILETAVESAVTGQRLPLELNEPELNEEEAL